MFKRTHNANNNNQQLSDIFIYQLLLTYDEQGRNGIVRTYDELEFFILYVLIDYLYTILLHVKHVKHMNNDEKDTKKKEITKFHLHFVEWI